jgi:hypothetical protein
MAFCDCPDPVLPRTRALTWEDHPGCGWPAKPCEDDTHGQIVHDVCGRVVEVVFCTCERGAGAGFCRDPQRDWWVHVVCGWPTRAWFEADGKRAPARLRGVKPRLSCVHEKRGPMDLKRHPLTPQQRELDVAYDGRMVCS